jgi:hypothetical protein
MMLTDANHGKSSDCLGAGWQAYLALKAASSYKGKIELRVLKKPI